MYVKKNSFVDKRNKMKWIIHFNWTVVDNFYQHNVDTISQ